MRALEKATPERLSTFSDGVFAVLITVLVLDLRPPAVPTFKALLLLWPTWLSYGVSDLFIAIVWVNHHYLMRYATEANSRLLWFNFAHLFAMSLLPLSTAWMAVSELAPQPRGFLCAGLFRCECNLHLPDLGAGRHRRGHPPARKTGHAVSGDRDSVLVRGWSRGCAKISVGWSWYLYLLPGRLPQARTARGRGGRIVHAVRLNKDRRDHRHTHSTGTSRTGCHI